jgi:hypothetical protein
MGFSDDLQYRLENISIYFQGGVRRSVLIATGVVLVLLTPAFFTGKFISSVYANSYLELKEFAVQPVKTIYDYEIGKTNKTMLLDGNSVLYLAVNNKKNIDVGYYPWNYSVEILDDQGNIITSKQSFSSYLLPNDNKYLVVNAPGNATEMRVLEEPGTIKQNYNPNANPLQSIPNIETDREVVTVDKVNQNMTVYGVLRNRDRRTIRRLDVVYLVRNIEEQVIFAGTASFNNFIRETDREFNITNLPLPQGSEPSKLSILWSVNYLDPNNLSINQENL